MKKIISLAAMTALIGHTLCAMEITEPQKEKFNYALFAALPKELKRGIVSLYLESNIAEKYRSFQKTAIPSALNSLVFSPHGKTVLTGSGSGVITLWDAETAQELRTFDGHRGRPYALGFSPDSKKVLSSTSTHKARIWNAETADYIQPLDQDVLWVMTSAAFSPDGKTVLTGCARTNNAYLWDVETGEELGQFVGHTSSLKSVAFSPDGKTVLTCSADFTARLWDVETAKERQRFIGHTGTVYSVAFSPDEKTILTGSEDGTARLWDVDTGEELQIFAGHTKSLCSVAFSPNGKTVLTCSFDKTVRLWDVETAKELQRIETTSSIFSVVFSPDGKKIAFGTNNLCFFKRGFLLEQESPLFAELKEEAYNLFKKEELYHLLLTESQSS